MALELPNVRPSLTQTPLLAFRKLVCFPRRLFLPSAVESRRSCGVGSGAHGTRPCLVMSPAWWPALPSCWSGCVWSGLRFGRISGVSGGSDGRAGSRSPGTVGCGDMSHIGWYLHLCCSIGSSSGFRILCLCLSNPSKNACLLSNFHSTCNVCHYFWAQGWQAFQIINFSWGCANSAMVSWGLKPYSRADIQRTVGVRLHDSRVPRSEVPSDSAAVVMYDIVVWC